MSVQDDERRPLLEMFWLDVHSSTEDFPPHKRLAVHKYMRKTIQDMTPLELRLLLAYKTDLNILIVRASQGYDRFMAKRAKRDKYS